MASKPICFAIAALCLTSYLPSAQADDPIKFSARQFYESRTQPNSEAGKFYKAIAKKDWFQNLMNRHFVPSSPQVGENSCYVYLSTGDQASEAILMAEDFFSTQMRAYGTTATRSFFGFLYDSDWGPLERVEIESIANDYVSIHRAFRYERLSRDNIWRKNQSDIAEPLDPGTLTTLLSQLPYSEKKLLAEIFSRVRDRVWFRYDDLTTKVGEWIFAYQLVTKDLEPRKYAGLKEFFDKLAQASNVSLSKRVFTIYVN